MGDTLNMPPIENQPIKVKLKCGCETEVNPTQKEAYVECDADMEVDVLRMKARGEAVELRHGR